MKKTTKIIVGLCIALSVCIVLGIYVKITNDRKTAENTYIDYAFLDDFPVYGDMDDVCRWLEEHGYEYTYNNSYGEVQNGKTVSGWSFEVTNGMDGILLYMSWNGYNGDIVSRNCKEQLDAYYGGSSREGDGYAWYSDDNYVVSFFYSENGVSMHLGSYSSLNRYL